MFALQTQVFRGKLATKFSVENFVMILPFREKFS